MKKVFNAHLKLSHRGSLYWPTFRATQTVAIALKHNMCQQGKGTFQIQHTFNLFKRFHNHGRFRCPFACFAHRISSASLRLISRRTLPFFYPRSKNAPAPMSLSFSYTVPGRPQTARWWQRFAGADPGSVPLPSASSSSSRACFAGADARSVPLPSKPSSPSSGCFAAAVVVAVAQP